MKKARGAMAPAKIIECIKASTHGDFKEGEAVERKNFMELLVSDQSKAMRYVFFAEREVLKVPSLEGVEPRAVTKAGVIGSGTMGAGITISLVNSGMPVTVVENDQEALDKAIVRFKSTWERDVKLGRIDQATMDKRVSLLTLTTQFEALADVDIVIEAVFEEMALKKEIFGKLGKIVKAGAVLASNTSYLDIDAIGEAAGRPADVIGMHFFSPANIMRLVEVIDGGRSAKDALATGVAIGKRMGKLPVVMGNCDGFVGNRILAAWRQGRRHDDRGRRLSAGLRRGDGSLGHGHGSLRRRRSRRPRHRHAPPQGIRASARQREARHRRHRRRDLRARPLRPEDRRGLLQICRRQAHGRSVVTEIIDKVSKEKGIARKPVSAEQMTSWVHAAMVNEACKILSENIVSRPLDVDIVKLNGYGFPVWRGGPMCEADRIGLDKVLATVKDVYKTAGKGFEPASLLEWMVANNKKFADLKPGDAKGK